jgi:hypothetical protein
VSPVKYELRFCIPEDDILHSHRRENFKFYKYILFFYMDLVMKIFMTKSKQYEINRSGYCIKIFLTTAFINSYDKGYRIKSLLNIYRGTKLMSTASVV